MVDNYSKVHRVFLQACCNHGMLPKKQALDILAAIQSKHGEEENPIPNDDALAKVVDEINAKMVEHEIEQKLSFVNLEWNVALGEFLVLSSFASLGINNKHPFYNEPECNYMKMVIEDIVTNDNHCISLMSALNLVSSSTHFTQTQSTSMKITKQRVEELLEEWTGTGYLYIVDNEFITLGPRAIGEFGDTLCNKLGDHIQSCHLCNKISMKPSFCPNSDCQIALDKSCFATYVLKKKKCPSCKSNWEEDQH